MRGGRVAIVGGSVAGCAAALAAHRGGAEGITVYERAAGQLADRGVGLAMHNDRYAELEAGGYVDAAMPWIQLVRRCWYVRDGEAPLGRRVGILPFPFRTYNWGPLWRELRARVPESVDFRTGTAIDRLELTPEHAELSTGGGGPSGSTSSWAPTATARWSAPPPTPRCGRSTRAISPGAARSPSSGCPIRSSGRWRTACTPSSRAGTRSSTASRTAGAATASTGCCTQRRRTATVCPSTPPPACRPAPSPTPCGPAPGDR